VSDQDDKDIGTISIEEELKVSYLDYAMSVIVGRALPDVRDGLKPVHRRVLFAMSDLNNSYNRPHIKSARVVGEVIGKYHPHGDMAAYDTIVRMAQDFSMRYPLVDGQGNFGSLDGDGAAASRYTEVRMEKISQELLADLDKNTVDFSENYDGTLQMPEVLPSRLPNLLINGSSGIAVGMATNIPPHNLKEVISGCLALMETPDISVEELMTHIPGPDFPTAALINGRAGIVQAYKSGRGRVQIRSRCEVESDAKTGKEKIIIKEIPYQVNRAKLLQKIAELVKEKKVDGIVELRDESASETRIVIELRRGEVGEVVLNNLYALTQLQSVFGINMVALVEGEPKVLNLKEVLECFIIHRRDVVTRRTLFLLSRARARSHILEGLAVALSNIDSVIELIKNSANSQEAKEKILELAWVSETVEEMLKNVSEGATTPEDTEPGKGVQKDGSYFLTEIQAQAVLDMRLNRLTGMEREKLIEEYRGIISDISELIFILSSSEKLLEIIREELVLVQKEYGDERRTEIVDVEEDLTAEDLIPEQDVVVTFSNGGYAKTQPLDTYRSQRRGGRGKSAGTVKEEDFIDHLLIANTHETLLCFSNKGKVYWLKAYQIPPSSRTARGRPIINILPLDEGEKITALLPISGYDEDRFIFMATLNGTVKKTPLKDFSRPRSTGLIAIELDEDNTLVGASVTDGTKDVMLFSSGGKAIRIKESDVRAMGRTARGVRGIRLKKDEELISLIIPYENGEILLSSENGYGKRSRISDYSIIGRGGQGVICMKASSRNGKLVGAIEISSGDEVILISDQGTLVRISSAEVSLQGRNTLGIKLISLTEDEKLVGIAAVNELEDDSNS
jgi:DNA gyrase subunit A